MKGCLRCTRCLFHQRRDKGGNAHNFPFDTLTKVYRDSMYATQERYQGNPMYPERGPHGTANSNSSTSGSAAAGAAAAAPFRSNLNVTNHVGNIGVMSAAATPLSAWMEELHQPHEDDGSAPHHDHGHDHGHSHHSHHHHDPHQSKDAANGGMGPDTSTTHAKHTRIRRNAPGGSPVAAAAAAETVAAASSPSTSAADDEAVRARIRAHMFRGKKSSTAASSSATAGPRHSGVQVEILNMYRSMLREVRRMHDADTRRNFTAYIRSEFDKHRDVPRKNILKIEWQLNYGKRKLEDLQGMSSHTKFTMMR